MNILRDYQEQAVFNVFECWKQYTSLLVTCPTGTGKTQIFCEIIKRMMVEKPGFKVMVLVHTKELLEQAVRRLKSFGIKAGVEMAGKHLTDLSWNQPDVIVSTIQTQNSGRGGDGRMMKFKPRDFSLLVIDESHHVPAKSWKKVINFYKLNPELKVLGVTATPDRLDEAALGQIFEHVAFNYEFMTAINDGWLCYPKQQIVRVDGLDFSHVKTTAGDLNSKQLANIMEAEKNLHEVVSPLIEIIGNKKTLVFSVTVKQAELYCEIFNRHRLGMAEWICGDTPKEERVIKLERFDNGQTQIIVNVSVLTEGYDSPNIEVIAIAKPTKSRARYCQMVGRGTRPLPGIVDALPTAEERRMAIAQSAKPNVLVIDFCGNAGKHKLMTTLDILGGKTSDEVRARALKRAEESKEPVDMKELIEEEQEKLRLEIEERKRIDAANKNKIIAKAKYSTTSIDPFDIFNVAQVVARGWDRVKKPSEKMCQILLKMGIDPSQMSFTQASQMIGVTFDRSKNDLCNFKQAKLLKKYGYDPTNVKFKEASNLIDSIAKNGWQRPKDLA